jgi:uncharacterized membrane protein YfcA
MFDLTTMAGIAGAFFIAGISKGILGLGLPSISLAFLTVLIDLQTAMTLLLVPSFITNLYQGCVGGNSFMLMKRLWPFLFFASATIPIGVLVLKQFAPLILSGLLGGLLIIYAVLSATGLRITLKPCKEIWAGPLFGVINGMFTGMTGSFVFPGVMFMQSLNFPRQILIQAMGLLFTISTLILAITLQGYHILNAGLWIVSTASLVPALLGMFLGQKICNHLSERIFRKLFFMALFILGAYILVNAILKYTN